MQVPAILWTHTTCFKVTIYIFCKKHPDTKENNCISSAEEPNCWTTTVLLTSLIIQEINRWSIIITSVREPVKLQHSTNSKAIVKWTSLRPDKKVLVAETENYPRQYFKLWQIPIPNISISNGISICSAKWYPQKRKKEKFKPKTTPHRYILQRKEKVNINTFTYLYKIIMLN